MSTTALVVFPDATAVACSLLDAALTVPVRSKVPSPRPDSFVTVRRTGGVRKDVVTDNAQVTIEAWGPTEEAAHDLAQIARAHIGAAPGSVVDGVAIYRVTEQAAPGVLPDPLSDQPRYSQTFNIAVRGVTPEESP